MVLLLTFINNIVTAQPTKDKEIDYSSLISMININNIKNHVKYLSSLKNRVTGYPGYYKATEYIVNFFKELGLEPGGIEGYLQPYYVTVPIDHGSKIILPNGETIEAYALWPNSVQTCKTPPEGIEGYLIRVKEGTLEELSKVSSELGINIKDAIVLMDFNTMNNWLNAAKLGAKAVIFIEPEDTTRIEAESKFLKTPIYFPRLYVSKKDATKLIKIANSRTKVRIFVNMTYENVLAYNVIGVLKGKSENDIVIVSSYYDCWSIVPKLAPGADEATGIASLLEFARILKESGIKFDKTIWFVAFSGHWQMLAGAREFVTKYYLSDEVLSGKRLIWSLVNFFFSTDSDTLAFTLQSDAYKYKYYIIFKNPIDMINTICKRELEKIGYDFDKHVEKWYAKPLHIYSYYMIDSEPAAITGVFAISAVTTRSLRAHWGHPFNTMDKVNFDKLYVQVIPAYATAYTYIAKKLIIEKKFLIPLKYYVDPVNQRSAGIATVIGDVVRYDPATRWYTFEGLEKYDILVEISYLFPYSAEEPKPPNKYNPFLRFICKANSNGTFVIHGIGTDSCFGMSWTRVPIYRITAYLINKTTGQIEWITDMGVWSWPQTFCADRSTVYVRTSVFKCISVTLYDLFDPRSLTEPILEPNFHSPIFLPPVTLMVCDFNTHGQPIMWSAITPDETGETVAMVFVPKDTLLEVLIIDKSTGMPYGIIMNSSKEHPEGYGFLVKEPLSIWVPLQVANDMFWLDEHRFNLTYTFGVYTPLSAQAQISTRELIDEVQEAFIKGAFYRSYQSSIAALSWQVVSYAELKTLINDMTYTALVLSVVLVPFAVLAERFFVPLSGKKRVLGIVLTFLTPYFVIYFQHPGFQLALNAPIAILAFTLFAFIIVVYLILFGNVGSLLREIRRKFLGHHYIEISRSEAFLAAMDLGIEEMRKRKLRSGLTLFSIIVVAFALVSLTSTFNMVLPLSQRLDIAANYNGLLVEIKSGLDPISDEVIALTKLVARPEATVTLRAWAYPTESPEAHIRPVFLIKAKNQTYEIWGILGLMPDEIKITKSIRLIDGDWFTEGSLYVCVIPKSISESLGIKVLDKIELAGVELMVIGIVDDEILRTSYELDGEILTPIDRFLFTYAFMYQLPIEEVREMAKTRLPVSKVLIVPYELARRLFNAPVYSIAVVTTNTTRLHEVAQELVVMTSAALTAYVGDKGTTYLYSKMIWVVVQGAQLMIVPYVIAIFTILITMLNAVYERISEIKVFSAIGLAPSYVAGIFLAESLVYGVIGSLLGYIVGIIGVKCFIIFKVLPESFIPNFTSSSTILAIGLAMLAAIIATFYPSFKASKLVTPSLVRRWKLTSKPIGNEWFIRLPFVVSGDEVDGIMVFLLEYLEAHRVELGPFKVIGDINLYETKGTKGEIIRVLEFNTQLAPFDANIVQKTLFMATPKLDIYPPRYDFGVRAILTSGKRETWMKSMRPFIDSLRKQLLIWRGLPPTQKKVYIEKAKSKEV